jgi:hypothetical protein
MTASLPHTSPGHGSFHRKLTLTALFWAFSYVLLSIRGAIFHDDWSRLFDDNRLFAVTVGAAAYALVLRQLDSSHKLTLRSVIGWIASATIAVMIVRLTLDEMMFEVPQGVGVNLLWSLTWSAYFGLWVMGSLAFEPAAAATREASIEPSDVVANPVEFDNLEALIAVILDEAAELKSTDRARLANRVAALGGYECADGQRQNNERARLALRLAARLSDQS